MAIGLLRALHEAGRRVPEDISVVGYDDLPETEYLIPPLTTVRQDFAEVGRRAIELVMIAISGLPAPTPDLIKPELIIRQSTQRNSQPALRRSE
jgi:DNA-binding LacI/PurR family transcriptional regulator